MRAAGANPCRAQFAAKELQDAVQMLKAWLATETAPPAQLHWNTVARQQPTGAVEVIVEQSSCPATPLAAKLPQKGE